MSARTVAQERASIHTALDRMYEGHDELEELLDDLLQAHAHELAERIRRDAAEWDGWPEKQVAMGYAAGLIDPEVS